MNVHGFVNLTCLYIFIFLLSRRNSSGGGGNTNVAETQSRQSRDSPLGGSYSIVDETEMGRKTEPSGGISSASTAAKMDHKKSVFKKRNTSSPAMVGIILYLKRLLPTKLK